MLVMNKQVRKQIYKRNAEKDDRRMILRAHMYLHRDRKELEKVDESLV